MQTPPTLISRMTCFYGANCCCCVDIVPISVFHQTIVIATAQERPVAAVAYYKNFILHGFRYPQTGCT